MTAIPSDRRRGWRWLRTVGWGGAVALILAPLVAMQVAPASGVDWTAADFVFAIVLIGSVGLAFEAAVRVSSNLAYRLGAAIGLGTSFLLIWANAAVGYIGDDNPYNIAFFGVVAIAVAGALLARFRASGMAIAMLAAAIAHAVAGGIGYPDDPVTGPITVAFVAMWLASAALFRKAARAAERTTSPA